MNSSKIETQITEGKSTIQENSLDIQNANEELKGL